MWNWIKAKAAALSAWWSSDAVSSKVVRVPFKLTVLAAVAVLALALLSLGAGYVLAQARMAPVTQAEFDVFRNQMATVGSVLVAQCGPKPAAKAVTKKR